MNLKGRVEVDRRHWHLDKTISVGHLLSTLIIAISIFSWASSLDRRVEQNAQNVVFLGEKIDRDRQELARVRDQVSTNYREMNRKLDRILERMSKKK